MKKQIQDLNEQERIQTLDTLYTAASSLDSRESMKAFLRDLLTESERIMLGRRILIAQKLIQGKTIQSIAEELHVGYDTVNRIKQWLPDAFPGYETAVAEMEKEMRRRKRTNSDKYAFDRVKKKYPLHFLLFNVYDDLVKGKDKFRSKANTKKK